MTFEEILDHAMAMLQRHGRVTYRALQRQFQLDDTALDDLKEQLLYAHLQVVDDAGRGLIWTGATVSGPAAAAVSTHISPRPPLADPPWPRDESLGASHRVVHHAVLRLYEDLVSTLLQAIAPQDEDTLQAGLAQLVAAELLYQRGRPPWARYVFKHALIQDAA